jgi:hypothetical protein
MSKSTRRGPRRTRRPLLAERVEERLLLASFGVTNISDSGAGSLRQAILDSDATPGPNSITFTITTGSAPYVINVQSPLPAITVPVLIDGTSQPGYAGTPIIELDGGALSGDDALVLAPGSDGSTIQGLDIADFQDPNFTTGAGIHIESNGNLVREDYLGTDPTGESAGSGNLYGVYIDGSSLNTIGGTMTGAGNLISGNTSAGVLIWDGAQPALDNLVIGNKIGTDFKGTAALPNQGDGVDLFASNNTIGGTSTKDLNLISANQGDGVNIAAVPNSITGGTDPANNNEIQGNYIGTDVTGKTALGNSGDGVTDNDDSGNTIGGSTAGSGNLISANLGQGISLYGASNDLIAGNIVGTTPGQITDSPFQFQRLGNGGDGIRVGDSSTHNIIGLPGAGNLVVANQNYGIEISPEADFNAVSGNAVGSTLATGSSIGIGPPVNLGNASDGIFLSDASGNTIGGADQINASGQISLMGGNVVSSNGQAGISLLGNDASLPGNQGNVIVGNLVGTSADGSRSVGNASIGIMVGDSANNTIGGVNRLNPDGSLSNFNGNLVSGNQSDGLQFNNSLTAGNLAIGNRIGTDLSGTRALPNTDDGILITFGASSNTLGAANLDGSTANLISGNSQNGIEINNAGTTSNVVLGNSIGLTADGAATLPNLGDGVLLNAAGNIVGGIVKGDGNVISGNLGSGVRITNSLPSLPPANANDNQILGNLIGVGSNGISSGLGNVQSGVEIDSASSTTIGGVTATPGSGPGNIISGNRQSGIQLTGSSTATVIEGNIVGLDAAGTADRGNLLAGILLDGVSGNLVGGNQNGAGNVLSNNGTAGLVIDQGSRNTAQGNLIGTNPTGTSALGNLQNGLVILDSTGNTIGSTDDLGANIISGNSLSGISISGSAASDNFVLGNRIGTDYSGTQALGNGQDGVLINSALSNTLGGTTAGAGNLISANRSHGIEIGGTAADPAGMNVIEGNRIGTTAKGSAPLGNAQDGVFLASGSSNNTVGGTVPAVGNLISANLSNGVELVTGATANLVAGNLIGTDASGALALGNSNVGVVIYDTSANTIGGLTASAGRAPGNVISGNRSTGVLISGPLASGNQLQGNLIGTDSSGRTALPNASIGVTVDSAPNNLIGGDQSGDGNVIAANRSFGVFLLGTTATGNRIAGNLIGTNSAGAASLGNALDGLVLSDAPGNIIGGVLAPDRNVISGNGGNGIDVLNIAGADGVAILGNFIGTSPSGLGALGNGMAGVLLNGVSGTVIAGAALPNLISGNRGNGIYVLGSSAAGTLVRDSLIGTDISGTVALGNGGDGIALENASSSTIGGTEAGAGNVISGNAGNGIQVYGSTATLNVVLGDTIGTNAQGTAVLPNAGFGISIEGATVNLVEADLISGNAQGGLQITGFGADNNSIFGCTIGTDRAGEIALGNGLASLNDGIGVFINGADGNFVGGEVPGQGNLISGNATAGVYIFGRFASANTVQGNRIGTDAAGQRPIVQSGSTLIQQVGVLINDAPGLDIQDTNPAPGNTIGGSTANAGNVISGNIVGIMISGAQSSGNVVAGNLVGPGASGNGGAGNTIGVYINGAPGNTIGGVRGNVISGNSSVGVYILGAPSTGNVIAGNLIGLASDGIQPMPNQNGVYLENAPGNVIGGTSAAAVNLISANSLVGVYILGGQSVGNVVEGNVIGSNAAGGRAGNGEYGVLLYNAPANTVVRSGPQTNRITGSGIANYREFLGPAVTANPSGGRSATKKSPRHRRGKPARSHTRVLVGRTTPAGPLRHAKKAK